LIHPSSYSSSISTVCFAVIAFSITVSIFFCSKGPDGPANVS
jgi:hypothetical protein